MAFRDPSTVGAYRQQIVERLFGSMLTARLERARAEAGRAASWAPAASRGLFVKSAEASTLSAMAKDDGIDKTLEVLFTETERVTKFGFTATELDREKASYQRNIDQAMAEAEKRQSSQLADEYVRNFTQAEPFPGLADEADITRRMLPGISLAEVNGLAKEWMPEGNRVDRSSARRRRPASPCRTRPSWRRRSRRRPTRTADGLRGNRHRQDALLGGAARRAPSTRATSARDVGIIEWTLSNGVKVVVEADHVQAGRSRVPRIQSGRHVAGGRRGCRVRRKRPRPSSPAAAWATSAGSISARCSPTRSPASARTSTIWTRASRGRPP